MNAKDEISNASTRCSSMEFFLNREASYCQFLSLLSEFKTTEGRGHLYKGSNYSMFRYIKT